MNGEKRGSGSRTDRETVPSLARIEELLGQVDTIVDLGVREMVGECVETLLGLYGACLERIVARLRDSVHLEEVTEDELVRALLLVHGLHPRSLEDRLAEALESVRPYMRSHGGGIEMVGVVDGVARLTLEGHCHGCPSSAATMELAVRQAIEDRCPDLEGIEVDGVEGSEKLGFDLPKGAPAWEVIAKASLQEVDIQSLDVRGTPVMLCRTGGNRYAYRDFCPLCQGPMSGGRMEAFSLQCGAGHGFDVRRAGRSVERPGVHLDPLPLVDLEDVVKIAVEERRVGCS